MRTMLRWSLVVLSVGALYATGRAEILYGLTSQGIVRIDTSGPRALELFPTQKSLSGLCLDPATGTWYGILKGKRTFARVEPVSGKVPNLGTAEPASMNPYELARDPTSDVLSIVCYTFPHLTKYLGCYSRTTGAFINNSWTIAGALADISYDHNGKLWGVDNSYASLCYFDPKTGNMQFVNQGGLQPYTDISAFAVSTSNRFWAIRNPTSGPELLEINPANGTATLVGTISGLPSPMSIGSLTGAPPWKQFYCTAKSALVCGAPTMSATGVPSASGTGGAFTVRGGPVLGQKVAFLRYSVSGRSAAPWDGGYLCVSTCPPLLTVPVVASGQPGQCNGVLEIDMNAFGQGLLGGSPSPILRTPHSIICVQWWGRDTVATGTMMTDALQYVLWP